MKKKFGLRLLALLLVVGLLASMGHSGMVVPAQAATQQEIDALKNQSKDLAAQRKDLQAQIATAATDKSKAMQQKNLVEQQINVIQAEIDNLTDQITKYNDLIAQKQADLTAAQAEEQAQYQLFCQRVRYMEEDGQVSYWAILFASSDFTDLLDRFMIVEEIMEYDNAVMNRLVAMREQIAADKIGLEETRAQLEAAKTEQETARGELKARRSEVEALITQITAKQDELEKAEAELRAAAQKMDQEMAQKQGELEARLAAQGNAIRSEDGFIWPIQSGVRNYNSVSSFFGSRIHPVTGKPNNHTGIDIPVGGGVAILAAKSGVVLTATYNRSYGNYVVISHGGGQSTLYAHMRSAASVKEGDTVKQGQTLGYVGSTGSSTGNHLHFEIRLSGARVDPLGYYRGSSINAWYNGTLKAVDWNTYK